ncbi:MAG: hypothetical protein ACYSSP_00995 [Planctomycetota bacterium]|jgi:hypothetical protein
MNRTQKTAILNLVMMLFCATVMTYPFTLIFIFKTWPSELYGILILVSFVALMVFTHIFLRKKQSSKEPDSDERDDLIKRRAVLVSFVSVWILLAAATLIPGIILGQTGTISAYILPFINVSIFLIAMMVYSVAILVQYGWGSKGEKK